MISPLQLERFWLTKLSLEATGDFEEGHGVMKASINVKTDDPVAVGPGKYEIRLSVMITATEEHEKSLPYLVSATGVGVFHLEGDSEGEELRHMLKYNGSAIVFGLLRGQVAQVTAMGGRGTLWLPVVNLVQAMQPNEEANPPSSVAGAETMPQ